ncbi:MAG: hypothetical protein LBD71_06890 [Treponema sp.]|jgi:hypothetical protein|nr:hypothetical protein [Treponema sp.]
MKAFPPRRAVFLLAAALAAVSAGLYAQDMQSVPEERLVHYEERILFEGSREPSVAVFSGESGDGVFVLALAREPGGGGSFARKTALAFIERLSAEDKRDVSTMVLFLGPGDLAAIEGGRAFPSGLHSDLFPGAENTAFVLLDIAEAPSGLSAEHGSGGAVASLSLSAGLYAGCRAADIPLSFSVPYNETWKLGFRGRAAFPGEEKINIIKITGRKDPGNSIDAEKTAEMLFRCAELSADLSGVPDYRYSVFPFFSRTFFLSETIMAAIFTAAAALFILVFLCKTVRRPVLPRGIWALPLLCLLFFISLEISGLPAGLFAGIPAQAAAAGKITIALGLFFLLSPLIERRLPNQADFYGGASAAVFAVWGLVCTFSDLIFAPFFIIGFCFLLPACFIRKAVPVLACAFLAAARGIPVLLYGEGGLIARRVLLDGPAASLSLALLIIPFVFMVKRGIALARARPLPPGKFKNKEAVKAEEIPHGHGEGGGVSAV